MDCLKNHLNKIRIPSATDRVYKDECMYSFDTPESSSGLYVCLNTFYGFGKEFVDRHFQRTGNAVYLHILKERKLITPPPQGDGPEKKITRLAIGVQGGFDPEHGCRKFDFVYHYSVVILPDTQNAVAWPNPELPMVIAESVKAVIAADSATKVDEMAAMAGTWDGEARVISAFAADLQQLDNGVKVPPSGWQCARCDKTENLWLNLTDGTILCGRRFYDGSGGNNHAVEHYNETAYPLAVKLGTITKDGKGDVFSYKEDDLVEDPRLVEHLAHWGINVSNVEKTEKSMVELELELNQKTNEWAALQESDGQLVPIYGPGYTGMANLGNSCYLNSVMQMMYVIPEFVSTYVHGAPSVFTACDGNPAEDLNVQMCKLGVGLHSGKYSVPPPAGSPVDADSPGIEPRMFKALIGRGHKEFSTKQQQDAQEFFLHVLDALNTSRSAGATGRALASAGGAHNPAAVFQYRLEDRVQCEASGKVKYISREDNLLTLKIPMEEVINKEEVAAYESHKKDAESGGRRLDSNLLVRPKLQLSSLLEAFSQTEISRYHSTAINDYTNAKQTTRFETFPKYLVIHLGKYTVREDWVVIKLDVAVDMPDALDLSAHKATGIQPGEELLPASDNPPQPELNPELINSLMEMGFPMEACKRAVFFTKNAGLEQATQWLMEHIADADFAEPFVAPGTERSRSSAAFQPNDESLGMLLSMGFARGPSIKALRASKNDLQAAMDWIETHPVEMAQDDEVVEQMDQADKDGAQFQSKDGRFKLVAFVSHMGTSISVGHYVVHILKEGRWVIFNDNKVSQSVNPPKELGYMYLYERVD